MIITSCGFLNTDFTPSFPQASPVVSIIRLKNLNSEKRSQTWEELYQAKFRLSKVITSYFIFVKSVLRLQSPVRFAKWPIEQKRKYIFGTNCRFPMHIRMFTFGK